jgi:hypothetical protein
MQILAYSLFAAGALVSLLNFHLSFVLPIIEHLRKREARFISGIPLFGSLLLMISFFCLPADNMLKWPALVIALLDTGGLHWFCDTLLYHSLGGEPTQGDS